MTLEDDWDAELERAAEVMADDVAEHVENSKVQPSTQPNISN